MNKRRLHCNLRILLAKQDPPITQDKLHKDLGIGSGTVQRLYHNTFKQVDAGTIALICDYFQCELSDLFQLKE